MNTTIDEIKDKFLRMWATFSPYSAFSNGLREYGGFFAIETPEWIANYNYFLTSFQESLKLINYESLSEQEKIEFLLLDNKIRSDLFNAVDLDIFHIDPTHYLEVAFIFEYLLKNYAPLNQRVQELSLHLNYFPTYFKQAIVNLNKEKLSPELVEMAHLMASGMISFLANLESELKTFSAESNEPISDQTFKVVLKNNTRAIKSLEDYDNFLKDALPTSKASFRLGKEKYLKMLQSNERVENITIEKLLEACEKNLDRNVKEFEKAAKLIDQNLTVDQISKRIRNNHPTKNSLIEDTTKILSEVKEYCRKMVDVPSEVMPKVILTPKPFRPWAFAAMNSPGALETIATDSYYYITPPEDDWPEEQQLEWLETFNYKGLKDISVHECFPGHYLHHLHNQRSKYVFSKLFGAYHFWEGYALHVEEEMWQIGFQKGDYEYRMAQLMETLLRNVRMIVSIKLHTTTDFTVEDGIQLFMKYAYLGRKPAEAEAKRGTYDPGYLNYCLGKLMIEKLKKDYKEEKGKGFDNKEFYNTLLSFGAPPIPIVRKFMLKNKSIHAEIL